jgi:hypothetical protein
MAIGTALGADAEILADLLPTAQTAILAGLDGEQE